jgi:hypothetical protein
MAYHQEWVDFVGAGDAGLLVVEGKGERLSQRAVNAFLMSFFTTKIHEKAVE